MRRAIPFWPLLGLTLLTLSACGGPADTAQSSGTSTAPTSGTASAVQQALQQGTPVDPSIVVADNAFGLSLFDALNQNTTSNIAVSPTSIALALQMVYNGADGTTQQGMSQALRLQDLSALQVDQDNAALQATLINPDPQVQLTIANSLWMHLSSNPVLPSFTAANQTYYAAEIGDLSGAPSNVNAWVSDETDGLITDILPAANYADVVAVIANTIYFKGAWTVPFDPNQTTSAAFTLTDSTQVSCQMMQQRGSYAYLQGANFQMIQLPYGQTSRLSMLIILPAVGVSLDSFVAGMSAADLNDWIAQLQFAGGSIALPRFTSTYGISLVSGLTSLGMGVAFDPNEANFAGLAPNTYISDVEHKTVVEVDESGTVAAGATTVTISPTVVMAPSFSMTMDHPFFYAIRDNDTGVLLFIGALLDPTQAA